MLIHGFRAFRSWAFLPWVARRLVVSGYAAVTFDFSRNGVGTVPGRITETEAFARNTVGREVEEVGRVVDRVLEGDLIPRTPDRVALLGHGRGGSDAVLRAAVDPRVDALVTWAAVARLNRWSAETRRAWRRDGRIHVLDRRTGRHLPLDVSLLEDVEENLRRRDVLAAAAGVEVPWLILHGRRDRTVAPSEARALARRAPRARLVLLEEADHTFGVEHPPGDPTPSLERATRLTVDALDAALKRSV